MNTETAKEDAVEPSVLNDRLDAARFRWLVDQHTSVESTGDDNEYANCHLEYVCPDIEDDRAYSIRRMIDREIKRKEIGG
jgi:hypothetical protein